MSTLLYAMRDCTDDIVATLLLDHWTKKWIYIKLTQSKGVANICFLQSKAVAKVVKATFAIISAYQCKYGSKVAFTTLEQI